MIPRLKGVIAHDHDTKLPGENGEAAATSWGTRPSPKVKPFEKDLGDYSTRGRKNRQNLGKDPTLAYGWGNRPNPKKEFHVCRRGRQSGSRKVYTHPTADGDQTEGRGDMVDRYSDGHRGATMGNKLATKCTRYLSDDLDIEVIHPSQ